VLESYGGLGAFGRADQPSAKLVEQKIGQLRRMARTLPVIFLGVAAFLPLVLLSRIVGTQREQIAAEFARAICALGVAFGWGSACPSVPWSTIGSGRPAIWTLQSWPA
jgi:hypothetical protein